MEMLLKCNITEGKNATANMLVEDLNAFGRRQGSIAVVVLLYIRKEIWRMF